MAMQNGTSLRGTMNEAGYGAVGDDSRVWAVFRMHPVVDVIASKEAGRTIKKDVTYIKITQPGEANNQVYDQPATDADVDRFPRQWAAFKANQEQTISGSPLELLFPESPAIVENLRHIGFRTIEQLSEANDTALQGIGMGARQWKERAVSYLATADKGKDFHGLSDRLDKLELKNKELSDRNAALEAALAEATAAKSKGRTAA